MRLIVTKNISLSFKERLLQQGYSVVDIPLIEIKPILFELKELDQNVIFTSQSAVHILLQKQQANQGLLKDKKYFCVGEKVKSLLEKNGQKVVKMSQNASELAHSLVMNHKNEQFSFFCGTRRMDDLELVFAKNEMKLNIIPIYDTLLTPHKIKLDVDGILFYSPSAVESFFIKNKWPKNTYGFCIGKTTANALKKYTDRFYVASQPKESALLVKLKQHFSAYA